MLVRLRSVDVDAAEVGNSTPLRYDPRLVTGDSGHVADINNRCAQCEYDLTASLAAAIIKSGLGSESGRFTFRHYGAYVL